MGTSSPDNLSCAFPEAIEVKKNAETEYNEDEAFTWDNTYTYPGKAKGTDKNVVTTKEPRKSSALEYDIKNMYPEIGLLIKKKRKEWDFKNPEYIRAIWLESKTNALAKWKEKAAKIDFKKPPKFPLYENGTIAIQKRRKKHDEELAEEEKERERLETEVGRSAPNFPSIQVPSTLAAEQRVMYGRNDPPIPSLAIKHFIKYKKPPFKVEFIRGSCKCTE